MTNEERWESAKTRSSGTEHFGKSSGTEHIVRWDSAGTNNVLGQHIFFFNSSGRELQMAQALGQRSILKLLWDRA